MRKIVFPIFVLGLVFISVPIFAEEQPLPMRKGLNPEANQHHTKGIESFNQGNYEEAYKHFRNVLTIAPSAEGYFNGALSLHKWGFPKEAANFFYYAKKYANGNTNILQSDLVKQYVATIPQSKRRAPVPQAPLRSEGS
ncbi:tetratricopeptide repeat protein [Nitrospina gracilis]|nr:tetratricopeptide repeat protein [Nitrospina gracilis]